MIKTLDLRNIFENFFTFITNFLVPVILQLFKDRLGIRKRDIKK
jgi:hypothetical protein